MSVSYLMPFQFVFYPVDLVGVPMAGRKAFKARHRKNGLLMRSVNPGRLWDNS